MVCSQVQVHGADAAANFTTHGQLLYSSTRQWYLYIMKGNSVENATVFFWFWGTHLFLDVYAVQGQVPMTKTTRCSDFRSYSTWLVSESVRYQLDVTSGYSLA